MPQSGQAPPSTTLLDALRAQNQADLTVAGHSLMSSLELGGGRVAPVEGGFALSFPEPADV